MNQRIAVGILTKEEDRGLDVLICCRPPHKTWAGYWEFPGGKLKEDENGLSGLTRELQEELNVHCLAAELLVRHNHTMDNETLQLEFWRVTSYSGTPVALEGQEIRWQPVHDLMTVNFLPGDKDIIHFLRHYLQKQPSISARK